MADMKILQEVEEEIQKCMKCGECQEVCPVFKAKPREALLARGKIRLLKGVLKGELEVTDSLQGKIDACLQCNACLNNCPPGVDTEKIIVKARQQMRADNRPLDEASAGMAKTVMENNNPFNEPADERENWLQADIMARKSDILYFSGCSISYSLNKVGKSLLRVLDLAGIEYTSLGNLEKCCGDPLMRMGLVEQAEKNMAENRKNLKEKGIKTIFTSCAGCVKNLKHALGDEFEVYHAVEFIDKLMEEGKIEVAKEFPKTVIYHDGCDMGRHAGIYEAPRSILKRIPGINLVEFEHNRKSADCCGGPFMGPYPDMAQEIGAKRVQGAMDKDAEVIVTACPSCLINLKSGGKDYENAPDVQDVMLLLQKLVKKK